MKFKLLTYNTLFSKGLSDIKDIITNKKIDILCLQEVDTDEKKLNQLEKFGFRLADYSNSFIKFGKIYGVATYYDPKRFKIKKNTVFNLPRSFYEMFLFILKNGNKSRTVLQTQLECKQCNKSIFIYNAHLSPLTSSNGTRMKQIESFLPSINGKKNSTIIAGDFNFSYNKKRFEKIIKKYNLKEATNNLNYTHSTKILKIFPIRLKLDYILYRNLKNIKTERLQQVSSDHIPILSEFEI